MRPFRPEKVPKPRGVADFQISQVPAHLSLDVEIGCGVGMHPIRYIQEHPDRYLIAIEHTRLKFEKFSGRLSNHEKLERLWPVHADAVAWITHFLKPATVSRYFILYPNPEPQEESSRWYAMPFMARIKETMKAGGELVLATNVAQYAERAKQFMKETWGFEILSDEIYTGKFRTHFEKKYQVRGDQCRNLIFKKP